MGRRRHAFIGWDEDAIWLERNDAIEWKVAWKRLAGMRVAYTEGALNMRVGSELLDDEGNSYRLPVHWRTQYPREVQEPFLEIVKRLPEGKGRIYASCPRPTAGGSYRVLGIGVVLSVFGIPAVLHLLPGSSDAADPMLAMTQMFALMGGVGVLCLGFVDLFRARRPSRQPSGR